MKRLEGSELQSSEVLWQYISADTGNRKIEDGEMEEAVTETTTIFKYDGKSKFFVNARTGKKFETFEQASEGEKRTSIIITNGKTKFIKGIKFFYDKKQKMFCFAICRIDAGALCKSPSPREWEEIRRLYISDDGKYCTANNVKFLGSYALESYVCSKNKFYYLPFSYQKMLGNCTNPKTVTLVDSPRVFYDKESDKYAYDWRDALKSARKKYGDIVPIAGNKMAALDNPRSFITFLRSRDVAIKNGKKQNRLDELITYDLPDAGKVPEYLMKQEITCETLGFYTNEISNVPKYAVIQRVPCEEPMCVIRTFSKSPSFANPKEGGRIYVGKSEVISSRLTKDGTFMYQTLLDGAENWNFYLKDFDADVAKGTKLEYYAGIIPEIKKELRGIVIWSFLKWPLTEQMYKMDLFRPLMEKVFERCNAKFSPIDVLNFSLGTVDIKAKNVWQAVGMNKQQAEILIPKTVDMMPVVASYYYTYQLGFAALVKNIIPEENAELNNDFTRFHSFDNIQKNKKCHDISDIDINTIKELSDAFDSAYSEKERKQVSILCNKFIISYTEFFYSDNVLVRLNMLSNTLRSVAIVYGLSAARKVAQKAAKVAGKDISFNALERNARTRTMQGYALSFYRDYIFMVDQAGTKGIMKPYFETVDDIVNMHNLVQELVNLRKDQIEAAKWKNCAEKSNWGKWEYDEEGEAFIVVAPKKPEELTAEGIALSHCVGGYIGRVLDRVTNIMFIRKKEDPDKPFFTVEVSNNGTVEQVHGFGNCCASSCYGMPEFVKKWAKERKLTLNHYDKVR